MLARRLGISALGLSRITSSLLIALEDGSKSNIGLSLKFESKGLKVLGYSKRNDRGWEYSETTARALERYKAAFPEPFNNLDSRGGGEWRDPGYQPIAYLDVDIVSAAELCPTAPNPDKVIKDMKKWLKDENLINLEPVSLFAEQLEKVSHTDSHQLALNSISGIRRLGREVGGHIPSQQVA